MARPLVRKALDLLPEVGFVNAYGLTETSSTIAVLTPEDHRAAHVAPPTPPSPGGWTRSVARYPDIEVQIRAEDGTVLGPGETGELFVRGPQVSGRYAEIGSVLDARGLVPDQRRCDARRGRLPVHRRPVRRHHHPRR